MPAAVLTAVVVVICFFICRMRKVQLKHNFSQKRLLAAILSSIYLEVVLEMTFFSREPGSRKGIDWILFETWGRTSITHALFIENILLFVPFGFLMPMVFEKMQKAWICVGIGCLSSCAIELSQLMTQRGYCQIDDVMTNTIGTLLGWLIWKSMEKMAYRHKK